MYVDWSGGWSWRRTEVRSCHIRLKIRKNQQADGLKGDVRDQDSQNILRRMTLQAFIMSKTYIITRANQSYMLIYILFGLCQRFTHVTQARELCITDISEGMSEYADIRFTSRSGKRYQAMLGLESKLSSQYYFKHSSLLVYQTQLTLTRLLRLLTDWTGKEWQLSPVIPESPFSEVNPVGKS